MYLLWLETVEEQARINARRCRLQTTCLASHAAVDDEGAAGAIGGSLRGQENGEGCYFFWFSPSAQGDFGHELRFQFRVCFDVGVDGSVDCAGGDVVDGDLVWGEFDGDGAHQHAQAAFRGAIRG